MTLPILEQATEDELDEMGRRAGDATDFLKALAHESRLMILCYLAGGPRSVTELEQLLSKRQPSVSQQLARLRNEGLVTTERHGKTIYYSIADPRAVRLVDTVYDMFCARPVDANGLHPKA